MIGSISSDTEILAAMQSQSSSSNSSLATSQLETISSVLENYDASNLSQILSDDSNYKSVSFYG